MKPPPIIPVLDLMIGQIVLAAGGVRDEYRPVDTKLTRSSQPLDVAKAIFNQTGCDCLYLADIDSFAGAEPNWEVYNQLLDAGFGLWVDANWLPKQRTQQIAEKIQSHQRLKIILSSETMATVEEFQQLGELMAGGITPIFSLDKKGDVIITKPGELNSATPLELVQHAYRQGVRDLIILDLTTVGTKCGFTDDDPMQFLFQEIHEELEDMTLISGGGVHSPADARRLLGAGCQHVLVATAIHECRFTPDDVTSLS